MGRKVKGPPPETEKKDQGHWPSARTYQRSNIVEKNLKEGQELNLELLLLIGKALALSQRSMNSE